MIRRLILMRHAKSSWDNPLQSDHDRPLNKRGRRSADALGNWLRGCAYLPDEILCSTAARTCETCDRLRLDDVPTRYLDRLYMAGPDRMLAALQGATGATVLMLGHNPGIGDFAQSIVAAPPQHDRFADYPTGATLVVAFEDGAWADLRWRAGTTEDFVVPHEL